MQGFLTNADLERDIWQKGFSSLAAAAAGGQLNAAGKNRAALECKHFSLLLTEPLFNFDAVRALTEEVSSSGAVVCCASPGDDAGCSIAYYPELLW